MATKLPTQILTAALRRAAPVATPAHLARQAAPANTLSTSARRLAAGASESQSAPGGWVLARMWRDKKTRPYVVGGALALAAADVVLYYEYAPSFWAAVKGEDKN